MIEFTENTEWDYNIARNTTTITLTYSKKDRYCVKHYILPFIRLIAQKRSNETHLQDLMSELLDDCMRDYFGELKERI